MAKLNAHAFNAFVLAVKANTYPALIALMASSASIGIMASSADAISQATASSASIGIMASSADDISQATASSADDISQAIVPPVVSKRGRPDGWDVQNPVAYKFRLFHPTYDEWRGLTILRLHSNDGTCTTNLAPFTYHGSWKYAENSDLVVEWHPLGDPSQVKEHVYRKIEKTECWELVNHGKSWYYMLLPVV